MWNPGKHLVRVTNSTNYEEDMQQYLQQYITKLNAHQKIDFPDFKGWCISKKMCNQSHTGESYLRNNPECYICIKKVYRNPIELELHNRNMSIRYRMKFLYFRHLFKHSMKFTKEVLQCKRNISCINLQPRNLRLKDVN